MKKDWTPPAVIEVARAEDAEQNFGLCSDGQSGRGRRVNNCS